MIKQHQPPCQAYFQSLTLFVLGRRNELTRTRSWSISDADFVRFANKLLTIVLLLLLAAFCPKSKLSSECEFMRSRFAFKHYVLSV